MNRRRSMLYKTFSAAVYGIDANIIEVEVDVSGVKLNEVHFHTVGLPDAAVRVSQDCVRSALRNCGYDVPPTHITVNLAPADIRKEGSRFDLPMALGILGAYGGLNKKELLDCAFVGELSLDGGIRRIRGTLPITIETRSKKLKRLIVPEVNAREAAMVSGVDVYPVRSLMKRREWHHGGQGGRRYASRRCAALRCRLQRCARTANRQASFGDFLRRRPQRPDDRAARVREDYARQAHADHPAALHLRGGPRDYEDSQRCGRARAPGGPGRSAAVPVPTSHHLGCLPYRWGGHSATWGSLSRTQWRAVSR